jgi:hypothetical protein
VSKKKRRSERRPSAAAAANPAVTSAVRKEPAGPATTGREFSPDYTFIVKDLRRIGVLAGSFIVVLIVLSFFLH